MNSAARAIAWTAGFAATWALLEAVLVSRLQRPYSLAQVEWCRFAVHLAVLAPFAWRLRISPWRTRRPWLQAVRATLLVAMPLAFAMAVARGTPVHVVIAQFWIAPLLVMAAAAWWLRERAPPIVWSCAAIAPLAALVVHEPSAPGTLAQVALPLGMAASFALYVVATRALRREPVVANLFFAGAVPLLLLTPWMPATWVMPTARDAVLLAAIGVVGLAALYIAERMARLGQASVIAPALGLQIVFVEVLSTFRGDAIDRGDAVGIAMLTFAVAVLWWRAFHAPSLESATHLARQEPR